jgi:hypothetical protein
MKSSNNTSRWFCGLFAAALSLFSINGASAQVLWYNGDNNGVTGLFSTNSNSYSGYSGLVYDDFTVTSSGGWQVEGVYGNFLLPGAVSNANWAILSGVSAGNGGTVVASGTSSVSLTAIGTEGSSTLYKLAVTGLNFNLAPGTYWLGLQPISSTGYGYLVTTSGANAIGTPAGNDGNAFWTEASLGIPLDGLNFKSTTSVASNLDDFSLGVTGVPANVPEPSSWALTFVCVGLLAYLRTRSRRVEV